jgi:hypothetical protein
MQLVWFSKDTPQELIDFKIHKQTALTPNRHCPYTCISKLMCNGICWMWLRMKSHKIFIATKQIAWHNKLQIIKGGGWLRKLHKSRNHKAPIFSSPVRHVHTHTTTATLAIVLSHWCSQEDEKNGEGGSRLRRREASPFVAAIIKRRPKGDSSFTRNK